MGSYEYPSASLSEPLDCYLHGYVSSRIMRLASKSKSNGTNGSDAGDTNSTTANTSSSQTNTSESGLPMTISATKVDGLVLSLTPNSHSYNYRSAVLHGYASLVTDPAEKVWAMQHITNSIVPDRWRPTRVPPDNIEMTSTNILRVRVVAGSGKTREGGPHDEKKDLDRTELRKKTWVGVVPVMETLGEPIASEENWVKECPGYIGEYVRERNEEEQGYAVQAARLP